MTDPSRESGADSGHEHDAASKPVWTRQKGPILYVGGLSHRVYLAMAYKETPDTRCEGRMLREVVGKKYDVTDEVGNVLAELDALDLELTPKKAS